MLYCDPPYRGTTGYAGRNFDHEAYYDWVRRAAEKHIVVCSEYEMPSDFSCVWKKQVSTSLDVSNHRHSGEDRTEKLFMLCPEKYGLKKICDFSKFIVDK